GGLCQSAEFCVWILGRRAFAAPGTRTIEPRAPDGKARSWDWGKCQYYCCSVEMPDWPRTPHLDIRRAWHRLPAPEAAHIHDAPRSVVVAALPRSCRGGSRWVQRFLARSKLLLAATLAVPLVMSASASLAQAQERPTIEVAQVLLVEPATDAPLSLQLKSSRA